MSKDNRRSPGHTDIRERLLSHQKTAFEGEVWAEDDLLAWPKRLDNTFAQYSGNCSLIALQPFVETLVGKNAVTVCDGRGSEASYLTAHGLRVTATDIAPHLLPGFKETGRFGAWSEEDAEGLSFSDSSFDWGMVKAGLHHLPRPMLGFYDLLRVSREGIIMLEGHDAPLLRLVRRYALRARDWEPSGNYVYRFTVREIEKMCLGLNLPGFAETRRLLPWKPSYRRVRKGSLRYRALRTFWWLMNRLAARQGNRIAVIVFKQPPSGAQRAALKRGGFRYKPLPGNPHLS